MTTNNDSSSSREVHQAILDACKSGDLGQLKRLFRSHGIKKGGPAIKRDYSKPEPTTGIPITLSLIITAIEHKQNAVLRYILEIYPTIDVGYTDVIPTALRHGNTDTFEILYKHDPRTIIWEDDSHRGILVHACRLAKSDDSVILWLVNHGADPTIDSMPIGGAVSAAIREGRSLMVIEKLMGENERLGFYAMLPAVTERRLDVLRLLRKKGVFNEESVVYLQNALCRPPKLGEAELAGFIDEVIAEVQRSQMEAKIGSAAQKVERTSFESEESFQGKEEKHVEKRKLWWQVWK